MSQQSIQLASEYAKAQSEELEEQQAEEYEIIRQMESDFEYGWYEDDWPADFFDVPDKC